MHVQHSIYLYLSVRMGRNRDYYSDAQREKKSVKGHSANDDVFIIIISLLLLWSKTATLAFAQVANFSFSAMDPSHIDCNNGLICRGDAHRYKNDSDRLYNGRLALIYEDPNLGPQSSGVIYYMQPVRLLDHSINRTASFSTSYTTDIIMQVWSLTSNHSMDRRGDGMTFVLTADNKEEGKPAKSLGIYDGGGKRSSKTIVVEFDSWLSSDGYPFNDINGNHVSIDFMTIYPNTSRDASDVGITLWHPNGTLYTWIDYSAETQLLEVRISRNASKPRTSFLNYTVNLFDVADELMWAGFSAGNGDAYSHYYITDWVFNSSGIAPFSPRKRRTGFIVAMAVLFPVLALLGLLLLFVLRKRSRRRKRLELGMASIDHQLMMDLHLAGLPDSMSYKQLSAATRGFSDESKLGQGGFGSVYRGVLPASNTPVAVKRIGADSKQGEREFMAEVSIISQLRHRNLIQLVGWCMDRGKYLLVYELMPHGSLDKALFLSDGKESAALSWNQRFNIATGSAAALDYLHQGWKQQVIHRDVKASNIMLDDEWNAKLGDFGLARLVDHQGPSATTMVAGTYGYIAPEATLSGKFTEKTDVFAFGAVLLEIACGRKAFDTCDAPADEAVLVDWVWQQLSEGDLLSVVDKRLGDDFDVYWMEVLILMGLLCSHPDPNSRPPIRQVVEVLAGHVSVPPVPASKPAAAFKSNYELVCIEDLYKGDPKNTTSSYSASSRSFTKASMSSTGRSYSSKSSTFSGSISV